MSHKNKECLKVQAQKQMSRLTCLGQSKYDVKKSAGREYDRLKASGSKPDMTKQEYINVQLRDKIFSYKTYETYEKHNNYFLQHCEKEYGCKTLAQCREHVDSWLQSRIDQGLSAYTIKLEAAALGKLYQEPTTNFIATPERARNDIERSRHRVARDYGFSIEKNKDIINFCRGTGLRRNELATLTKEQLIEKDGRYYLGIKGKGGRYREAEIVGPHKQEIIDRIQKSGERVWERVPSHMDVHGYRSDYATAIYKAHERELKDIPIKERYYCRGDRKGEVMDKKAMEIASEALGHSRLEVIAGHYIR